MYGPSYPSLITHGYGRMTKELLGNVLSQSCRLPKSIWGLFLNGESIIPYPWCGKKSMLSFFDIAYGYDRRLIDVVALGYLPYEPHMLKSNIHVSFNSNCLIPSNRSEYMKEFMSHIPVEVWGMCGRNKGPELPPEIAKIQNSSPNVSHYLGNWPMAKKAIIKYYQFTIAFENSFEYDYVTEKLWHPLVTGSIPIYYGAPNIDDWLPCENYIIDLRKFPNPNAAAAFIASVAANQPAYAQYHKWREQPILPKFQKILDYLEQTNSYKLDTMVCAMTHSKNPQVTRYRIDA